MINYKIKILIMFITFMCTISYINANNTFPLIGKTIYIDSGHGGMDKGATYKNISESEINLQISKYLKEKLEKQGAIVYMTRTENNDLSNINSNNKKRSDLSQRARIINESNADMYISIHLNSDPSPTWSGIQTFYTEKNKENKKIAKIMQEQFKEQLDTKRNEQQIKNMYLYDKLNIKGVLIEAGFLSNPNDRYLLKNKEYQEKLATLITTSIIKYYGI